jgi:hypothetical protein
MNHLFLSRLRSLPALLLVMMLSQVPAMAGPGAHGPNGEHLDGPATSSAAGAAASPRFEAKSESFELVATLLGDELSMLIDRFATNEPLLRAEVEVESGNLKAKAKFHSDLGDYSVDDPAMLKLLSAPGEHALVITVIAGNETDLLDGALNVTAAQLEAAEHGHDGDGHGIRWLWIAIGIALIALMAVALALRQKRLLTVGSRNELNGSQA